MQVSKWGNSLALRLPATVVEALNLKAGDHIDIQIMGGREIASGNAVDARAMLASLRKFRGRMPPGYKFDRLAANEVRGDD